MTYTVRRRDVLACLGTVALAGCVSSSGDASVGGSSGTATQTREGTRTDGSSDPTTGTTAEPEIDPELDLEASVLQSFDAEHPARLRLSLTNRTDSRHLLSPGVKRGIDGPLTAIRGSRREDRRELLLFYRGRDVEEYALCGSGDGSPIPDEPVDGCWRVACRDELETISAHGPVDLEPGETLAGEYTVLDGLDGGCLEPGRYEFEDSTAVGPARRTDGRLEFASEPETLERRLTVRLEGDGTVSATAEATTGSADEQEPGTDDGATPQPNSR
ncbi:MAG: hypothetical protein ACOCR0_00990 [Haloferacaceae archaeon]